MTQLLRPVAALVLIVIAMALNACGADSTAAASASVCGGARTAAVRLMLENLNAAALPRAYERRVLRARMKRFMAADHLDANVADTWKAIKKLGGRSYSQSWTQAMTVGKWEACDVTGSQAAVIFLAYKTYIPYETSAMTRYTVTMHREHGGWRLVTYDVGWLDSAGPSGDSGKLTIRDLPERVVFRDPPPRTWHYQGPPLPPGTGS